MYRKIETDAIHILTATSDVACLQLNMEEEQSFEKITVLNKWNDGTYFIVITFKGGTYEQIVPYLDQLHIREIIGLCYDATIAPFKVQQIGDWLYRAELEDIESFIKRWSNFETDYVDARYVFAFLKSAGIPFVPQAAVNKCYAPDQDPEYQYVVEWRQTKPYSPVSYKERS